MTYVWDFTSDSSRALSVGGGIILGGLWSGTQRTLDGTLAYKPSYKFRVSLKVQRTAAKLDVPVSEFVTTLWTARANYSFATNAFLDSLIQYDAARQLFNANIRFNSGLYFMHHPELLSDLARLAYETIQELMCQAVDDEQVRPGVVAVPQTFGSLINPHPHLHLHCLTML